MRPIGGGLVQKYDAGMILQVTALFIRTTTAFRVRFRSESGAAMVEYAFLIALIAMAALVAVTLFGSNLNTKYVGIGSSVSNA